MGLTITAIVCAYNESRLLPGCLYSLRAQTRIPDDILVIDNASTDETGAVARAVPGVRVVKEPDKGLVVARETQGTSHFSCAIFTSIRAGATGACLCARSWICTAKPGAST